MLQKIKNFLFHNRTTRQTVAKNTFWLFFGQFFGRVLRGFIVIYAARVLGVTGYGVFSYAVGLAGFFTIFSEIGLNLILTREAARNPELRSKYLGTTLVIRFISLAVTTAALLLMGPLMNHVSEVNYLLPIAALLLAFDSLREFFFSMNRALEKMESEAGVNIFLNFVIVGLGWIFLTKWRTPASLMWAYVIGSGLGLASIAYTLRRYLTGLLNNFSKELVRPILTSAWPFALMNFFGGIMINIDLIMLGWWRGAEEIGFYSAAQKPVQFLYIIPALISSAIFPAFARISSDEQRLRNVTENMTVVMMAIALPIVLGSISVGAQITRFLYGTAYLPSTTTFRLLIITVLAIFPINAISNAIFVYDKQRIILPIIAIATASNVIGNIILIPRFGIEGAAVSIVASQILYGLLVWWRAKKVIYFSVIPKLKKVITAGALMFAVSALVKDAGLSLYVNVAISAAIYAGALWILKEPITREIKAVFARQPVG